MNKIRFVFIRFGQLAETILFFSIFFAACAGLNALIPDDALFTNAFIWSLVAYIMFFSDETIIGARLKKKDDAKKEDDRIEQLERDVEKFFEENRQ